MKADLQLLFPAGGAADLAELCRGSSTEPPLRVGDDRMIAFLTACAKALLRPAVARALPELAPLGFFLRRSELDRHLRRIAPQSEGGLRLLRFPRGLVFHVPPANVDTIFVYSWALSALAGNRNVVRISPRASGTAETIFDILNDALADADPVISQTQKMVVYDRDDSVTAALSSACDLRVLWGGDASINTIRRQPVSPLARDLTFPDRTSFAIASVDGWERTHEDKRRRAVRAFFNDAYWFDQAACASPRSLIWVGSEKPARRARDEFAALLQKTIEAAQFTVGPAMAVQKRVLAYGAAVDDAAHDIRFHSNALMTLEWSPPGLGRRWLGTGGFAQTTLASLTELTPLIERRDQTLCAFGFEPAELERFLEEAGGAGFDRVVPWGSALSFSAIWDGFDLLREFTRVTTLAM